MFLRALHGSRAHLNTSPTAAHPVLWHARLPGRYCRRPGSLLPAPVFPRAGRDGRPCVVEPADIRAHLAQLIRAKPRPPSEARCYVLRRSTYYGRVEHHDGAATADACSTPCCPSHVEPLRLIEWNQTYIKRSPVPRRDPGPHYLCPRGRSARTLRVSSRSLSTFTGCTPGDLTTVRCRRRRRTADRGGERAGRAARNIARFVGSRCQDTRGGGAASATAFAARVITPEVLAAACGTRGDVRCYVSGRGPAACDSELVWFRPGVTA